jgi:hypothetical protein
VLRRFELRLGGAAGQWHIGYLQHGLRIQSQAFVLMPQRMHRLHLGVRLGIAQNL